MGELPPVTIERVELRRIRLPLKQPFRTAHGTETNRDLLLVRVTAGDAEGWGECVAPSEPGYTEEYVDGAADVLERFLVPALLRGSTTPITGHRMAKAALATAVLDARLKANNVSLATYLGAIKQEVDSGVAVGITDDLDALLAEVASRQEKGYRRVKLKIQPGWDVEPVTTVRRAHPDLALHVDANESYALDQAKQLRKLDELDLLMIEQPLARDDLLGHARLARHLKTPICLDESIVSTKTAETALELGACRVINVKPGRVGGLSEAKRLHDLCLSRNVDAWVGGMLETGIGRAANVALAALPGFTLPGDLSASDRYWHEDLTEPFVLRDGRLEVPTGPGIGREPRPDRLAACTVDVKEIR